jgi:hypothetical protein
LTSKKGATGKKKRGRNMHLCLKYPRRNSTRVANKYRLKSKAMFDPSIKEENVIVIEDHSEDSKKCQRKGRKASITQENKRRQKLGEDTKKRKISCSVFYKTYNKRNHQIIKI